MQTEAMVLDRHGGPEVLERRTIELDPNHADAWLELIECHSDADDLDLANQLTFKALETITENREGIVQLNSYAFEHHIDVGDKSAAEGCLKNIVGILAENEQYPRTECELVILELLGTIIRSKSKDMLPFMRQMLEHPSVKDDSLIEFFEHACLKSALDSLLSEGYPIVFCDLLSTIDDDCNCQDCLIDIAAMEANILFDVKAHRPFIARLKKEHADLFALHSAFFNEALITRDPDKLFNQRLKKITKWGAAPEIRGVDCVNEYAYEDFEFFEEEPSAEVGTFRREGPKIGRNDPCTCGSGKKFKKCCG